VTGAGIQGRRGIIIAAIVGGVATTIVAYLIWTQRAVVYKGEGFNLVFPQGWQVVHLQTPGIPSVVDERTKRENQVSLSHRSGLAVLLQVYPQHTLPSNEQDYRHPQWVAPRLADLQGTPYTVWKLKSRGTLYEAWTKRQCIISGKLGSAEVLVAATVPKTATLSAEATRALLKELLCSLRVDNRFLVGCRVTYTDIPSSPTPSAEWRAEGVRLVLPNGWLPDDLLLPGTYSYNKDKVIRFTVRHRDDIQKHALVYYSVCREGCQDAAYTRFRGGLESRLSAVKGSETQKQSYMIDGHEVLRLTQRRQNRIVAEWYYLADGFFCFARSSARNADDLQQTHEVIMSIIRQVLPQLHLSPNGHPGRR